MRGLACCIIVVGSTAFADPRPMTVEYNRLCWPCHGDDSGDGPAARFTIGDPRAFGRGEFEWRTTPIGKPPTADDLRTTIRYGAPGTSMPAFGDVLTAQQIDDLVAIVAAKSSSKLAASSALSLGTPPKRDPARGRELWSQRGCARCHGADGRGSDVLAEKPYDLTTGLRRPRASDDVEARRTAAATSIAMGMTGTAMPGYADQLAPVDLWALADHVVELSARAKPRDRRVLAEDAIERDRKAALPAGTWPGPGDEAKVFGAPLEPQGKPPASLSPAQASLDAEQCGRCHTSQVTAWRGSLHATAWSVGFVAQVAAHGTEGVETESCARCHAPLVEQQADRALAAQGVSCGGCHVRGWVRLGPPNISADLAPLPNYPAAQLALYERSDFCMTCHQLPPRGAVNGKPLLNTYKEWLESPYMARGIQCQHCHMPKREHRWLGVHDRDTFRQAIELGARAHRKDGVVTVVVTIKNVGAGHDLPTTPTPAAWVRIELVDAKGTPIAGARGEQRIGRDIYNDGTWHEHEDTRIAPGETRTIARAWRAGRVAEAALARVTVDVHPDDFYEQVYAARLREQLSAGTRAAFEQALARAKSTPYIAEQRDVPIALEPGGTSR